MRWRCSWVLVACWAAGWTACGAAVPALPGQGGPAWLELESEHFTLWTDTNHARATELIEQMEYLHQIVYGVAFPALPRAGRSFAIALRDGDEVHAYVDKMFVAFALVDDNALNQPAIVFAADTDERDGHVIAHELTHVISDVAIRRQPVWFAEGIAQFFETVRLEPDEAVVDVGEPLPTQLHAARRFSPLPGAELFACKKQDCRDPRFYSTAALLFAFLANTRPAQLLALEERLAQGDRDAWAHAVPDLPVDAIARELRAWEAQGHHRIWHFQVQLAHPRIAERTLADGEVLAARAFLMLSLQGNTAATRQAIAAARAADPTNLMAVLVENQRHRVPLELAREMTRAHPDDWRSWLLVLSAKATGDEFKLAQAHLCTLVRKNPASYINGFCPDSMLHPIDVVPGAPQDGDQPAAPEQVP